MRCPGSPLQCAGVLADVSSAEVFSPAVNVPISFIFPSLPPARILPHHSFRCSPAPKAVPKLYRSCRGGSTPVDGPALHGMFLRRIKEPQENVHGRGPRGGSRGPKTGLKSPQRKSPLCVRLEKSGRSRKARGGGGSRERPARASEPVTFTGTRATSPASLSVLVWPSGREDIYLQALRLLWAQLRS